MKSNSSFAQILDLSKRGVLDTCRISELFDLLPLLFLSNPQIFSSDLPYQPPPNSIYFLYSPSTERLKTDHYFYEKRRSRNNRGILETRQKLINGIEVRYANVIENSDSHRIQRRIYSQFGSLFKIIHYIVKKETNKKRSLLNKENFTLEKNIRNSTVKVVPDWTWINTKSDVHLIMTEFIGYGKCSVFFGDQEVPAEFLNPYCIQTSTPSIMKEGNVSLMIKVDQKKLCFENLKFEFRTQKQLEKFDLPFSYYSTFMENLTEDPFFNFDEISDQNFGFQRSFIDDNINNEIQEVQRQEHAVKIQSKFRAWRDRKKFKILRRTVAKIKSKIKRKRLKEIHELDFFRKA